MAFLDQNDLDPPKKSLAACAAPGTGLTFEGGQLLQLPVPGQVEQRRALAALLAHGRAVVVLHLAGGGGRRAGSRRRPAAGRRAGSGALAATDSGSSHSRGDSGPNGGGVPRNRYRISR